MERLYSLAKLVVFRLSMSGEVDRPRRDVDVHDPVDDLRLEVSTMNF